MAEGTILTESGLKKLEEEQNLYAAFECLG